MNDALYIAATGMHMQQKGVDTISNNLANVNTPGFKKGRVSFEDLVYRDLGWAAAASAATGSPRLWQGSGVGVASILQSFIAGELKKTDAPMDLAIRGDGFFEVVGQDGTSAYTRGGTLTLDKDGFLATGAGYTLKSSVHIGKDARSVVIEPDGRIMARLREESEPFEAGRIEMVRFADASGLAALGGSLYQPSERSGEPITGRAGEDGWGSFAQGYVEGSNVSLVEEMVDLMVAQRAYESSVKVIQAADEMLAMSNNLRK